MRKKGLALVCSLGLVFGMFSGVAGSPGAAYASGGFEETEVTEEIVDEALDSDVLKQDESMAAEENTFSGEMEALADGDFLTVDFQVEYAQSSARDMLDMINNFRTDPGAWYWNNDNQTKKYPGGLGKLTYDKDLEAIAMQRAVETALYFAHTRPNGSSFSSCTSNGLSSNGENLVAGSPNYCATAEGAFIQWREDQEDYQGQGHRRNMLRENFQSVGIGHVVYNGFHFWAQEFGVNPAQGNLSEPRNEKGVNVSVHVATSMVSQISGLSLSAGGVTLQGKGSSCTLPGVSCSGLTVKGMEEDEYALSIGSCVIFLTSWQAADPSFLKVEGGVVTALKDEGKSEVYAEVFGKRVTCSVEVKATTTPPTPTPTPPTPDPEVEEPKAQTLIFGEKKILDIAGKGRTETSFLLADQMKKALGVEKFQAVILASGADYPDGLGASTLSVRYNAPIIIVMPNANEEAKVKQYIANNLNSGGKIFIVGGTGVVTPRMQTSVSGLGVVTRLEGRGRYETNTRIIKHLLANDTKKDELLVVSGKDYADALSVSATGKLIMLVGDRLTEEQKTLLKTSGFGKVTIIGGSGAVSESVRTEIAGITGKHPERLGGKGRVETSRMVAQRYCPDSTVSVYTKANQFADGLAGGFLAYTLSAPMRLAFGEKDMTAGGLSIRLGGVK